MSNRILCRYDDVPDNGSRGFRVGDTDVFAVRKDGKIRVFNNRCPHTGLSLNWMPDQFLDRSKQYIQCAVHGALFEIDGGLCLAGPCVGQRLTAVAARIADGAVLVEAEAATDSGAG